MRGRPFALDDVILQESAELDLVLEPREVRCFEHLLNHIIGRCEEGVASASSQLIRETGLPQCPQECGKPSPGNPRGGNLGHGSQRPGAGLWRNGLRDRLAPGLC